MSWDPHFSRRSPMFTPVSAPAALLSECVDWPSHAELQRVLDTFDVRTADGHRLRVVPMDGRAVPYELRVRTDAEMPVRERDWHDLFNVLAWAAYPRTKAALNDAHAKAWASGDELLHQAPPATQRGPKRDASTLLDESGVIAVSCDTSLVDDLRAFRWKRLFHERRDAVRSSMRFFVFGHALFEKALWPYTGLTGHAVLLEASGELIDTDQPALLNAIDTLAAGVVEALASPRDLQPLPVLGVPGWWPDNERPAFYDNAAYFRPGRRRG